MENEIQEETEMGNLKEKLASKFDHIVPEGVQRIFEVELDKIRRYEEQARKVFDEDKLSELAESIRRHWQLMPIILKREDDADTYLLVAGERRYRACQKIGKTCINAVLTSGDPAEINLIENVQREDLHPLDLAERLNQMIQEHGYSQGQLSEVVNKPRKKPSTKFSCW
jgi:ParB family transcriptional regulator, chromosome partitioning protein